VEQDPDFIMLSRQFKATAMELISVLELVKLLPSALVLTFTENTELLFEYLALENLGYFKY